jgi:hypothetical protein
VTAPTIHRLTPVRAKIARTVALLDQATPEWASRIDVETLNLYTSDRCVLGQVYGSYAQGAALLREQTGERITCCEYGLCEASATTSEWAEIVAARVSA